MTKIKDTKKKIARVHRNSQQSFGDLLEAIDRVNTALEESKTEREFAEGANSALKYLSKRMDLTKRQCVILAIFIDCCCEYNVSLSLLARRMCTSITGMLREWSDLDKLEERGYIVTCHNRSGDICFRMPLFVLDSLKRNQPYVEPGMGEEKLTIDQFFAQLDILFKRRDDCEITYSMLCAKLERLLKNNAHLEISKRVLQLDMGFDSQILLLYFCHSIVSENEEEISNYEISKVLDAPSSANTKRELTLGNHRLQREDLIEYACCCGTVDRSQHRLTDKAKQELLADVQIVVNEYKSGLTPHSEIIPKELFYNDADEQQITNLCDLLSDENYQNIRQRLKQKGMRQGFACLFYGSPGTGKTETVLQLAKRTHRDIMRVDISQLRSKWVGESEKNIKSVFDQYRRAASTCKTVPILFFNEADAILNLRQEGASNAVEKMENSLQNIILEQLENLDGIFIATTNLAGNLDPAFERRFLFKVDFHKPSLAARTKIWKSMLPDVPEADLAALAAEFDFSGGQIENIARHYAIDSILYGQGSIDKLRQFCQNERIDKKTTHKIGFA